MAYLTKADLVTHIYPEIIKEIIRDYSTSYANSVAFPVEGITGRYYVAQDNSKTYIWNGDAYEETEPFDIVADAIDTAVAEAKGYLSRFKLIALFGSGDTAPSVVDKNLKSKVKDLACWYIIKLANPNIDVAMFRTAYEDAIKLYFQKVQSGDIDPEGWIYKDDDDSTDEYNENDNVQFRSNTKRSNHY